MGWPGLLLAHADPVPARHLLGARAADAVIEAGDQNAAVRGLQAGDDPARGVERIGDDPSIAAGMEVAGGTGDLDFGVHQAAGGGRHRGHVLLRERSVEQHHGVRAQAVAFGLEEGGEDDAAALLLTLDRDPQVDGQSAAFRLHRVADGGDQRHVVRLAVAGAARVDLAIADGRLEGRRLPLLERVRGLDVVVAVDQDRRAVRAGM